MRFSNGKVLFTLILGASWRENCKAQPYRDHHRDYSQEINLPYKQSWTSVFGHSFHHREQVTNVLQRCMDTLCCHIARMAYFLTQLVSGWFLSTLLLLCATPHYSFLLELRLFYTSQPWKFSHLDVSLHKRELLSNWKYTFRSTLAFNVVLSCFLNQVSVFSSEQFVFCREIRMFFMELDILIVLPCLVPSTSPLYYPTLNFPCNWFPVLHFSWSKGIDVDLNFFMIELRQVNWLRSFPSPQQSWGGYAAICDIAVRPGRTVISNEMCYWKFWFSFTEHVNGGTQNQTLCASLSGETRSMWISPSEAPIFMSADWQTWQQPFSPLGRGASNHALISSPSSSHWAAHAEADTTFLSRIDWCWTLTQAQKNNLVQCLCWEPCWDCICHNWVNDQMNKK